MILKFNKYSQTNSRRSQ